MCPLAIGLEAQERTLKNLLTRFKSTLQGGSCVLSGRSGSGKTLVLEIVRQKCFPGGEMRQVTIDCWEETSSVNALNRLLGELQISSKPKLIVVDHFEKFNTRRDQKLLYSVLNASQTHPWFVVMVCSTEDAIDSLEKRIKSRLSKMKINFNVRFTLDQVEEAFFKFLADSEYKENSIAGLRVDLTRVRALLERVHCRHSGLRLIKQLAVAYSINFLRFQAQGMSALCVLQQCVETICPTNEMLPILQALSLRHLCVLRCIALLQRRSQRLDFTYVEVYREYSRFCKNYGQAMEVDSSVLYRDVDELVDRSVLNSAKHQGVGQSAHRRISLDVEDAAIDTCISRRTVPTNIRSWLEDG